jgi:hypothetical protein
LRNNRAVFNIKGNCYRLVEVVHSRQAGKCRGNLIMEIKPIKNLKDYNKALKEINKLWNANPNTPEGDMLEVLVIPP